MLDEKPPEQGRIAAGDDSSLESVAPRALPVVFAPSATAGVPRVSA